MPRERLVKGKRVADAIRESDRPFVTTGDIAEYLDVTAQAVRNNANHLADHDEIEKGRVAQSSVYWLAKDGKPTEVAEASEPPEPPEKEYSGDAATHNESKGILERLFASSDDGMPVPAITLLLLGIVLPLMALSRLLDGAVDRLTKAADVYANNPENVRFPKLGSTAGQWAMTFFSGMLGLTLGVATGIIVFEPVPVVAQYAVSAVLALGGFGTFIGIWHTWNTQPAVNMDGEKA